MWNGPVKCEYGFELVYGFAFVIRGLFGAAQFPPVPPMAAETVDGWGGSRVGVADRRKPTPKALLTRPPGNG